MGLSRENIPPEWLDAICTCPRQIREGKDGSEWVGYPQRVFRDDSTRLFTCVVCRRPSDHTIHRCMDCSDVFLKDFGHPFWSMDWPKCWPCLLQMERKPELKSLSTHCKKIPPTLRYLYVNIGKDMPPVDFSEVRSFKL